MKPNPDDSLPSRCRIVFGRARTRVLRTVLDQTNGRERHTGEFTDCVNLSRFGRIPIQFLDSALLGVSELMARFVNRDASQEGETNEIVVTKAASATLVAPCPTTEYKRAAKLILLSYS